MDKVAHFGKAFLQMFQWTQSIKHDYRMDKGQYHAYQLNELAKATITLPEFLSKLLLV